MTPALGSLIHFKCVFNLRAYYDGTNPILTSQNAILYDIDSTAIVPESFTNLSLNNDLYRIY